MTEPKKTRKYSIRIRVYGTLVLIAVVALLSTYPVRSFFLKSFSTSNTIVSSNGLVLDIFSLFTNPSTLFVYIIGYLFWVLDIVVKIGLVVFLLKRYPKIKIKLLDPLAILAGDLASIARSRFVERNNQK